MGKHFSRKIQESAMMLRFTNLCSSLIAIQAGVRKEDMAVVTATRKYGYKSSYTLLSTNYFRSFVRNLGGTFGLAVAGTIMYVSSSQTHKLIEHEELTHYAATLAFSTPSRLLHLTSHLVKSTRSSKTPPAARRCPSSPATAARSPTSSSMHTNGDFG